MREREGPAAKPWEGEGAAKIRRFQIPFAFQGRPASRSRQKMRGRVTGHRRQDGKGDAYG